MGKIITVISVTLFVLLSVSVFFGENARPGRVVWRADLNQVPAFKARMAIKYPESLRRPSLHFVDARTLVLAFDDNNLWAPAAQLTEKIHLDESGAKKFKFNATFFDATTGKYQDNLSWETTDIKSMLAPTSDGKFLVLADEALHLYLGTQELHQEKTPKSNQYPFDGTLKSLMVKNGEYWEFSISPIKDVVVLRHRDHKKSEFHWLDADTLSEISDSKMDNVWDFAGSSNQLVTVTPRTGRAGFAEVRVVEKDGDWKKICDCQPNLFSFLSNEKILLAPWRSLQIVNLGGEILWQRKIPGVVGMFSEAAKALRIAYAYQTGSGNGGTTLTVVVFDWQTMKEIEHITFEHQAKTPVDIGFNHANIALSPDGRQLAIVRDSVLELINLEN
jgi:hypothetical protein